MSATNPDKLARVVLLVLAITIAVSAGFWFALSGRSDKRAPSRARLVMSAAVVAYLPPAGPQ